MEIFGNLIGSFVRTIDGVASDMDWLLVLFLFASVLLATFAGLNLLGSTGSVRQRFTANSHGRMPHQQKSGLRRDDSVTAFHRIIEKLEKHVVRSNEKEKTALRLRMIHAGYINEVAVRVYYLVSMFLAVSLPVGFLLMAPTLWADMSTKKLLAIAVGLSLAGLYLPYRFLQARIESRQRDIMESFPDALDMMVVCVEAGLGFDAMLARVSEQISRPHPILSTLIGIVGLELRAGKSREEALQNLAKRSGVQDISSFVTLLIQSEALGADLSQTLRVQAEEMRAKRMLRAEEQAHKLPVKLCIPLVLCILPVMFAVVLGPGMITIIRIILPALGN